MSEIDWLHFPPLPALRAFEATARLGGFSAAGRALNVTHAAVAQQVRALEAHLGLSLVTRDGRALRLTEDGVALAAALAAGFGEIARAVAELGSAREARPVTITLTPIFATNWLMPRLGRFWRAHPGLAVSLRPDPRVLDLRGEGCDFGIRFGAGYWPGVDARLLVSARYVVVAVPALFDRPEMPTPGEMADRPWVFEADSPEVHHWLKHRLDLDPARLRSVTEFATEELALTAARQGYGLHVTSMAIVEEDLREGRLRLVFDAAGQGPGYYLVTPPGPLRPAARTVLNWLLRDAG